MVIQNILSRVDSVIVECGDINAGLLTRGSHHNYQPFRPDIDVCLSWVNLPNKMDGINSGCLHPIFSQNLPEGSNRQFIAERLARYAKVDDIYLLALQQDNAIGMLNYRSDLELSPAEDISIDDILKYNSKEPLFPQLLEKYYLRNSLAGMQPKVAIQTTDRTLQQKNIIVKSFDEEFPLLTVNEFVCMNAAAHCGLNPPRTYLSENLETFVIERFDRVTTPTKEIRLGYEDFTTLLGRPNNPDEKYRGKYETILRATALFTQSQAEVEKIYKYIVFNCLIGNGDAHLKNFAIQYTSNFTDIFVSPLFDVTHTIIYPTIDNKMALKLCDSKEFPDKSHLIEIASTEHFRIRNASDIIDSMAQSILDYLAISNEIQLMSGLRESIEKSVANVMTATYSQKPYRHDRKLKHE